MEWTDEHDVLLLRELRASELFSFKKGSPERGRIWEEIATTLNSVKTLKFFIKDKRGVRDRWTLLQTKYKRKRREEEGASGIEVEEPTEKETLIEELCEKEDAAITSAGVKGQADKKAAEDTRKTAMERLGETLKRKKEEDTDELKTRKTRRSTSDAIGFLTEKMKMEQALHQEELEVKRKDQELQTQAQLHSQQQQQQLLQQMHDKNLHMQVMHEQSLQQQQQQNQVLMGLLQKLLPHQ